ncbi:MAG: hypothetical protein ACRC42_00470 [Mycoplasma sp.]
MHIGSTGEKGLHHMIWEIVENSIDKAMAAMLLMLAKVSLRMFQLERIMVMVSQFEQMKKLGNQMLKQF